jgi:hypothetical protein
MDRIPLTIRVTVPENIPELRGRHSTSKPFGTIVTVRTTERDMELIDKARDIIDPTMSRGLFIRQAVVRVAIALIKHHEEYVKHIHAKEVTNEREPEPTRDTRPKKRIRSRRDSAAGN